MKTIQIDTLTFDVIAKTELENFNETLRCFPTENVLLEKLLVSYKTFLSSFKENVQDIDFPSIQMFFICFREYIVSTQLIAQGHFSEGYSIISRASEAVGYGVIMKEDVEKAKIWIAKSGKKDFVKLFGEPFPKGNNLLHPAIFSIYNLTRDHGSHANFSSTMHFTSHTEELKFDLVFSDYNDEEWLKRNLLVTIHSFVEFLIVFKKLFHDNLKESWIIQFEQYVAEWISYREANKALFNY